jgi:CHAT domain-containing protein
VYLLLNQSSRPPSSERPRILVVANPTFDRRLFPRLPALPAAERISAKLLGLNAEVTFLARQEATPRGFFEHLGAADVLYFAGHAIVNVRDPSLSQLLLTAGPGVEDSGVVYARDIDPDTMGRARLVVLSACESATGLVSASEGISSLASVFLSGGVASVIGSVWNVEDAEAATLFDSFFEYLFRGLEPAEALRRSQLDQVEARGVRRRTWAAFAHIGQITGSEWELAQKEGGR